MTKPIPDDARRLLDGPNIAHVATLLPDGSPHSVPVWVGVEGERVAFMASPRSRKARNIARDPRIALSVTDREQPFTMARMRGRVVEQIDGDRGWQIIDRIAQKYIGQPYPQRTDRVAYLIEPESVAAASYG